MNRASQWLLARGPQALRKLVQLAVVAFVVYAALGSYWRNYKNAHNHPRLVALAQGPVWGELYRWNEKALTRLGEITNVGDSRRASQLFLGFPWGARIAGVETADPLMAATFALRNHEVPKVLWLSLLVPLGIAFVLGKVFCSHLCPMRLAFEVGQLVRAGLVRLHVDLPTLRTSKRLGGWVLLGGLVAAFFGGTAVWFIVLPYVALSASLFVFIVAGGVSMLAAVAASWWLLDVLVAPAFFCHNVCPTGFLLENVGRFSLWKLVKRGEEPCPTNCNLCQRACPYHLRPRDRDHRPACDQCGRCAVVCPSRRLGRRLTVLAAIALIWVLASPSPALAHHNKGLPHYGYFENYPQVPVDEFIRVQGRWEIGATIFNFQGYKRLDSNAPNDVKIFLYLYDLEQNRSYTDALDVEIIHYGKVISKFERLSVDQETIYSTRESLPESGTYELRAWVHGQAVTLPFQVDLNDGRVNPWILGAIAVPVLALFVLALLGRKRARLRVGKQAHAKSH